MWQPPVSDSDLLSIEVSIVWLGYRNVHPKRVTVLHDTHFVCHHGHSVECGLAIEEDVVAVHHMPMDDVAIFKDY